MQEELSKRLGLVKQNMGDIQAAILTLAESDYLSYCYLDISDRVLNRNFYQNVDEPSEFLRGAQIALSHVGHVLKEIEELEKKKQLNPNINFMGEGE